MNILIIGATSAVAQCFALRAKKRGDRLYCVARSEDKLQKLGQDLGETMVGSRCYDFLDYERAPRVIEEAYATLGQVDRVLFAQGLLPNQEETEHDFISFERTISVNLLSVVALLNPLHQRLSAQQTPSKVAVITSVAGDRGRPRNFSYGAAKGGLGLYLQGLRSKQWKGHVELYTVKLGPTESPMTIDHEKNGTFITADKAAELIDRGMRSRRYELYVPGFWRMIMLAVRIMPEWVFQRLKFLSAP